MRAPKLQALAEDARMNPFRSSLPVMLVVAAAHTPATYAQTKPQCTAFVGKWVGNWQRNSHGSRWLHVSEVSDQCVAKWAYLEEDREPKGWNTGTIVDGVLTVAGRTGGVTVYKMNGQEIWVTYTSPSSNGNNQAVFTRVPPSPK